MRIGVDVINRATIDADGGKQARVLGSASEIGADRATFEKDRRPAVSPLDPAIEIVPLINPANGSARLVRFFEVFNVLGQCDLLQQGKAPIQRAAIIGPRDEDAFLTSRLLRG